MPGEINAAVIAIASIIHLPANLCLKRFFSVFNNLVAKLRGYFFIFVQKHPMNNEREISISTHHFVSFYHKIMQRNEVFKKRSISSRKRALKALSLILETIYDRYVLNEGGVYLRNIGYLCHIMNPVRKRRLNLKTGDMYRKFTDGYLYKHICLDFNEKGRYYHLFPFPTLNVEIRLYMRSNNKTYKFLYRIIRSEMNRKKFKVRTVVK